MNSMHKTKLALAFGALIAVGLVGCNKPADETVAPPAPATVEAPAETMPAEPMTPAMPSTAAMKGFRARRISEIVLCRYPRICVKIAPYPSCGGGEPDRR